MKTDIEIAREAEPKTIDKIADQLGIGEEYLERYGKFKSKIDLSINQEQLKDSKNGKLILVTAISPTPAGELQLTQHLQEKAKPLQVLASSMGYVTSEKKQ